MSRYTSWANKCTKNNVDITVLKKHKDIVLVVTCIEREFDGKIIKSSHTLHLWVGDELRTYKDMDYQIAYKDYFDEVRHYGNNSGKKKKV